MPQAGVEVRSVPPRTRPGRGPWGGSSNMQDNLGHRPRIPPTYLHHHHDDDVGSYLIRLGRVHWSDDRR
eukprot:scaffold2131_cov384-Prasinococcus_capsulatus_cf.AAC.22